MLAKKIKNEALAGRFGGQSVCYGVKNSLFHVCLVNVSTVANRVSGNGLQICDGRALQHKCSFGELNFLLPQMCHRSTSPRLLQMCCYGLVFYSRSFVDKFLGLKIMIVKIPQTVMRNPI